VNSRQPLLHGTHVRLEPLERAHIAGLVAAAGGDLTLYQWSAVPQGTAEMARYVESALAGREAGTALPFATVRIADGAVVGSSRFFFDIERWPWASGHAGAARLGPGRLRDRLHVARRVRDTHRRQHRGQAPHADARLRGVGRCSGCVFTPTRANERSRTALARIGARFEGRAARSPPGR